MTRHARPVVWRAAVVALAGAALLPPARVAAAPTCDDEPAQALTSSEAAVSRPALRSPSEYALSNVYARTELATRPAFVYAEGGPQFAGAFEALLPAGTPPPPRAVSAYPSEDIPDSDAEDWGGHSETKVTARSAFATSTGPGDIGVPGVEAASATSFTSTVVECNVITIIAGWSALDVTVPDGPRFERLGQQVTLVVGPTGSSAKVDTTTVPAGRPFAPFTDPMAEGGGPRIEIGDPTTATGPGFATASGGGFSFLQTDPASGQGAAYRFGAVEASIKIVDANRGRSDTAPTRVASTATPNRKAQSVSGIVPEPAPAALVPLRSMLVSDTVSDVLRVSSPDPRLLATFSALLTAITAVVAVVMAGRRRYPTLDWIARRAAAAAARFTVTYLRW